MSLNLVQYEAYTRIMTWYGKAKLIARSKRITYVEIGAALGISESAVGHQLNGRREATLKQVITIADVLEVPLSDLLGDEIFLTGDAKEQELLDAFRQLSDDEKSRAIRLLDALNLA